MSDFARFADVHAWGALETRHDAAALDEPGFWAVVVTFEGELTAVRFKHCETVVHDEAGPCRQVSDPDLKLWSSSLDQSAYVAAVDAVRELIAQGEVYQVNVCRVLSRAISAEVDLGRLAERLRTGNPAQYAAHLKLGDLEIVCASPELYLARDGDRIESAPIKGTATSESAMLPKDYTENVMITDLVRNDLATFCQPGSVAVDGLCRPHDLPGMTHLVSTVQGMIRPGATWAQILAGTFPPGSVSGAPKHTALKAIRELEPVERGPYCGAIGYVDNTRTVARLAVGIRTFWTTGRSSRTLHFGTGAGITWGSDPLAEWHETELKARRLIALAQEALQ